MNTYQSHLDELMACKGSIAEAITESDRAAELLATILELIPAIDRDDSPQVGSLLNLVRGLEKEVVSYFVPIAARAAEQDAEREETNARWLRRDAA